MKFEDRVIGVFDVQSTSLGVFTEHDRRILSVLADIASVGITNARSHQEALLARDEQSRSRALQREVALARTFQERLLPLCDPEIAGFDIAGMNVPGTTLSGDYFDYIELPDGHIGVAVADVSGKGVPAALLAASLQATLRSQVENVYSIARIVERVNDLFCRITAPEHFATLVYGVFDPAGSFTYVNAGHNPPILISGNGDIQELSDGGSVLGMFPGHGYDEGLIRMLPGDTLVIYSDGLSEAYADGEEFGVERIAEIVRRATGSTARALASMLITEADSFADPEVLVDDMTVVVTKKLPS
jgi:sigma-B regulation protein RsbU (phosphoserine phosphatase)